MEINMAVRFVLVLIIGSAIISLAKLPDIMAWEKAHNYPYGRMCDPNLFNGWSSTCPR